MNKKNRQPRLSIQSAISWFKIWIRSTESKIRTGRIITYSHDRYIYAFVYHLNKSEADKVAEYLELRLIFVYLILIICTRKIIGK